MMDQNLIQEDRDLAYKVKMTTKGMAHWALSGPLGTTCKQCRFLVHVRNHSGQCDKYTELMRGEVVRGIHETKPSCKYFEPGKRR